MGKDNFKIVSLKDQEYKKWILEKHYAQRVCSISYAFGLVDKDYNILGVCTFGYPPNYNYNNGACVFNNTKVLTLELNRLVLNLNYINFSGDFYHLQTFGHYHLMLLFSVLVLTIGVQALI